MTESYTTVEQFVHDHLIQEVESGLHIITDWWRKERRVPPFLILWPEATVRCDDGAKVKDKFFFDLPEDSSSWKDLIQRAAKKTRACALFLATQREKEVRAIFESNQGTKSWHFHISHHGPDAILEQPTEQTNECFVGLLWKPRTTQKESR